MPGMQDETFTRAKNERERSLSPPDLISPSNSLDPPPPKGWWWWWQQWRGGGDARRLLSGTERSFELLRAGISLLFPSHLLRSLGRTFRFLLPRLQSELRTSRGARAQPLGTSSLPVTRLVNRLTCNNKRYKLALARIPLRTMANRNYEIIPRIVLR